ncbi:uncharacterized protein LOC118515188 [Anopheles stephensi]|uniref:uncharacterized protein LOC118515188 n=1 Tax=Anopheles stephensi TaxID=30069 RepID=UPI001658918A|nr:uncharacterized protein LOC118515188 [Anopheles stephensi]
MPNTLHSPQDGVTGNGSSSTVTSPDAGFIAPPVMINIPGAHDAATRVQDPEVQTMNALRLKPPELSTADIHTFFFALENWFEVLNIPPRSDAKRFNILKTQIPTSILPEVRHFLENVPSTDRYEAAKRSLIQHFEESQRNRLHRLLSEMHLGDRRPSQLLAEMRRTANGALTDLALVDLWISRLPPYVQSAVLAAAKDVDEKVKVADAVMDSFALYHRTGSYPNVSEVKNDKVEQLSRKVDQLSEQLEEVLRQINHREHSRPRSRSRPHSRANSPAPGSNSTWCYYHRTYGSKARSCQAPCSFHDRRYGAKPSPSSS